MYNKRCVPIHRSSTYTTNKYLPDFRIPIDRTVDSVQDPTSDEQLPELVMADRDVPNILHLSRATRFKALF